MKVKNVVAASVASLMIMGAGASASTTDLTDLTDLTKITWNVLPASPFPDTSPLDVSSVFGTSTVYFGKVVSAFIDDADPHTWGGGPLSENPNYGGPDADEDDPTFEVAGESSKFVNDFELWIDDLEITVGESGDVDGVDYDNSDNRDLRGGLYTNEDIRFISDRGDTANLGDPGFGIFWTEDSHTVLLAYADQNGNFDSDFNDLWVTATNSDVNVVPLPAAAWMLLAGLGGLFGLRRFGRSA